MLFSKRRRRHSNRKLVVENLSKRVVFSANPFLPAGGDQVVQFQVDDTGTLGTLELPDISLTLGTVTPGEYYFAFSIDVNLRITGGELLESPADGAITAEPLPAPEVIEPVQVDAPVLEPVDQDLIIEPVLTDEPVVVEEDCEPTEETVTPDPATTPEIPPVVAEDLPPVVLDSSDVVEDVPPALPLQPTAVLSPEEQLLLELVNRARENPSAEAQRLGIELNAGLGTNTISPSSKQPLAPNEHLQVAAQAHSEDMLERDFFSHTNPSGESPTDRALASGYPSGVGENIAWAGSSRFGIDEEANVYKRHDDLFRSADHRQNMLSEMHRETGVGVSFGTFTQASGTDFEAAMISQSFGYQGGEAFITGVVFTDQVVADDFYTIGEEVAAGSVTAVDSTGTVFETLVGPSGGYALQVPDGSYSVTYSDAGSATTVLVGGQNQKVDFNLRSAQAAETPPSETELPPVEVTTPAPESLVYEPPIVPPSMEPWEPIQATLPGTMNDLDPQEAAVTLDEITDELYVETFDSGQVEEFWTEFAPLATVEFVGPDGGDKALRVTHSEYEDRVVLRKELTDFSAVYASLETTFDEGFDGNWWSLKQMRLHNAQGTLSNAGTVDVAVWGVRNTYGDAPYFNWTYQDTGYGGEAPIEDFPEPGDPVRISMFIDQSTPGEEDGRFMLWLDDQLLVDDRPMLSREGATTSPSGLSFIQNYSPGYLLPELLQGNSLTREVDDILFLTDPLVEPELVHALALDHFSA